MSTLSPRLSLKRPDDTDPFLTQDYVDNYNKIDAAPGVHICTSGTKPSWGAPQAGRMIFMTDLKYFQWWDGSAWQDERGTAGMYAGGSVFNAALSKDSTTTYNLVTFTSPRPVTLAIMMNVTIICDARYSQLVYGRIVYDGSDLLLGNYSDATRFTGNSADTSVDTQLTMPMLAIAQVATAGSHTIGAKITIGGYNTTVTLKGIKTVAIMGTYASNQVL